MRPTDGVSSRGPGSSAARRQWVEVGILTARWLITRASLVRLGGRRGDPREEDTFELTVGFVVFGCGAARACDGLVVRVVVWMMVVEVEVDGRCEIRRRLRLDRVGVLPLIGSILGVGLVAAAGEIQRLVTWELGWPGDRGGRVTGWSVRPALHTCWLARHPCRLPWSTW